MLDELEERAVGGEKTNQKSKGEIIMAWIPAKAGMRGKEQMGKHSQRHGD